MFSWKNIKLPINYGIQWVDTDNNDLIIIDSYGKPWYTSKPSSDTMFNDIPTWTCLLYTSPSPRDV
jgi:hypothetical protein